jgi:integrase
MPARAAQRRVQRRQLGRVGRGAVEKESRFYGLLAVFGATPRRAAAGDCKARLDALSGVTDWRLHDLRRTVATGMQRLGVRLEITEAVLGHVSGSRSDVVGVYQRHRFEAEAREALAVWAAHLQRLLDGAGDTAEVVPLRRA